MEYAVKAVLTVLVLVIVVVLGRWVIGVWNTPIDSWATLLNLVRALNPFAGKIVARDLDAIYQEGKAVGRVVGEARQLPDAVVFDYIVDARDLKRGIPFEYQGVSYEQLSVELIATTMVTSYGTLHDALKNVRCRLTE